MQTFLVKDVSKRGFQWKILVCVARFWEYRDAHTRQNLFELDFVVVDREGNTMEGCVPANRIDQFKEVLRSRRPSCEAVIPITIIPLQKEINIYLRTTYPNGDGYKCPGCPCIKGKSRYKLFSCRQKRSGQRRDASSEQYNGPSELHSTRPCSGNQLDLPITTGCSYSVLKLLIGDALLASTVCSV